MIRRSLRYVGVTLIVGGVLYCAVLEWGAPYITCGVGSSGLRGIVQSICRTALYSTWSALFAVGAIVVGSLIYLLTEMLF